MCGDFCPHTGTGNPTFLIDLPYPRGRDDQVYLNMTQLVDLVPTSNNNFYVYF